MSLIPGWLWSRSTLDALLADYPLFSLPHKGEGIHLDATQRAENLGYFKGEKDRRCDHAAALLSNLDITLPIAGSNISEPQRISTMLDGLNKERLAKISGMEDICAPAWRQRAAEGRAAQILSFVLDLGIYCGECATAPEPGFEWTIDDTRYTPANVMATAGNIVISRNSLAGGRPREIFLDVMDWSIYSVGNIARNRKRKAFWPPNSFHFFDEIMAGSYA